MDLAYHIPRLRAKTNKKCGVGLEVCKSRQMEKLTLSNLLV